MDKLTRQAENEKFKEWWLKEFHKWWLKDEERKAATIFRHWAWKAWKERASK